MHRVAAIVAAILVALVAASLASGPSLAQPDLSPRALEPDELDADTIRQIALRFEIDRLAFDAMGRSGVPGLVVTVAYAGEVVAAEAYGSADIGDGRPLTLDDPLWLASLTKVLTATVVLDLVAEGVLDLDDPLEVLLPGLVVPPSPDGAPTSITLRHLLTHTAGFDVRTFGTLLPHDEATPPLRAAVDDGLPPRIHPPGTRLVYCNLCYALLGMVVEEATGETIDAVFRTRLFEPLALPSGQLLRHAEAAYEAATARPHGRTAGGIDVLTMPTLAEPTAGQARLSGSDVGRLLSALTSAEPPAPFDRGVRTALISSAFRSDPALPGWTLGMSEAHVLGHEVVTHGGDLPGAHSLLTVVPDAALAIFVHVNGESAPETPVATADGLYDVRWALVEGVIELLLGDERRPATGASAATAGGDTEGVAGTYRLDRYARGTAEKLFGLALVQVPLDVEEDGAVVLHPPASLSTSRRYLPAADGTYVRDHGGDRLAFTRDAAGRPLVYATIGSPLTLERVPPFERLSVTASIVASFALLSGVVLLSWVAGAVARRRGRHPRGDDPPGAVRAVRWAARAVALTGLVALGLIAAMLAGAVASPGARPPLLDATLVALVLTSVATLALASSTMLGATSGYGGRGTWAFHAVVTLAAVALLAQAVLWNLTPWS